MRRDVFVGKGQTEWFIRLAQKMKPEVWTLENIPVLYKYFAGQFPTVKSFRLNDHCKLAQRRKRLLISSRPLSI